MIEGVLALKHLWSRPRRLSVTLGNYETYSEEII